MWTKTASQGKAHDKYFLQQNTPSLTLKIPWASYTEFKMGKKYKVNLSCTIHLTS